MTEKQGNKFCKRLGKGWNTEIELESKFIKKGGIYVRKLPWNKKAVLFFDLGLGCIKTAIRED